MRKIILTVVAALSAATAAAPASATLANDLVLMDTGTGTTSSGNRVDANCQAGPGATLDLNYVTYVVRGIAQASSTRGSIPVGTTVTCWIKDTVSGTVYGPPVTGFAPTGSAAALGTIRARSTGNLKMCAEAYALFNDNLPPAHYKTTGC